jgi:hypothetical protein
VQLGHRRGCELQHRPDDAVCLGHYRIESLELLGSAAESSKEDAQLIPCSVEKPAEGLSDWRERHTLRFGQPLIIGWSCEKRGVTLPYERIGQGQHRLYVATTSIGSEYDAHY